ncbi:MAG: pyridoxal phosphate-dependent aminotransferase [Muribaculaceae bacterium]|nr:pyridoxal phosphate-dependent aminotransferase [Muribaculaceae bacterium]MDE5972070.1 pyridoxal phosphate-dependent aminotransferase [Muribaculaceae bacterium]MDE6315846.1 pyridoxal phosphate-dependent aminotransferase [Muribaculaceae bacterium]MDE6461342.1 pyridoxal phosphate-dependent aminotransferase [Muribaculaceae bacterium]MDE6510431.1 pyridoxal phosphate-dependent aminotransferase [Muribaculaceae bacterium]
MQISNRVQSLAASATLAMSQKSAELKAQGVDVINLSVGEPDFPTPSHIKEAAKKAIDDNFSFYTPVPGYLSLRKAIAEKLKNENGVEFAPEQIVVGNGAKQELCNVILAAINPGDEVIIPTPAWVSYVEMVKLAEGVNVLVPASIEQDFKITPEQLEAAITERTRMVLLCSPSNPTGSVYSPAELQALVNVLARHPQILVMADEIYEHINFGAEIRSLASFPELKDRVVVINGVSKAYAMTGWRIGYCACPPQLAKAVSKLQGQYTSGASSIAQKAAEAAYTGSQQCVEEMRQAFERRRDLVVGLARQIPGLKVNEPQGAFYLFPEVSAFIGRQFQGKVMETSGDIALYLLEHAHVATVDGAAFCAPGYIRLSYATSDDNIREALSRMARAFAALS